MKLEEKELASLAEKLNLSKDEMLREGLKYFLERKLREIRTEIYKIRTRYGVSSVEEFENFS